MQSYADTNQHYVSQFMLRGFHTGSEAQIWVFDKLTGRSYNDAISSDAGEYGHCNIAGSPEIDGRIRKVEEATAPMKRGDRARKAVRGSDAHARI